MNSFVTQNDIIKLTKYLTRGGTPLGESTPDFTEPSVLTTFNNYDYAITITIKGANKIRALEGNLQKQYNLFKNIISTILDENTKNYYFNFELHKCGLWLHAHGIIKTETKNIAKIKKELFIAIEGQKLQKFQSYSRRIKIDKLHNLMYWLEYIKKDEEQMLLRHKQIKKIYKLSAGEHANNENTSLSV